MSDSRLLPLIRKNLCKKSRQRNNPEWHGRLRSFRNVFLCSHNPSRCSLVMASRFFFASSLCTKGASEVVASSAG